MDDLPENQDQDVSINILPIEVLNHITSFLGTYGRQQASRKICQKWQESFDCFNEIQLGVTDINWKLMKEANFKTMHVTFRSFSIPPDLNDTPTKDFLVHIRVGEFTRWMVSYNLATILNHCVNMECLRIVNCELECAYEEAHFAEVFDGQAISHPKLRTFKYCSSVGKDYSPSKDYLLTLLRKVLQNTKLVEVELSFPYSEYVRKIKLPLFAFIDNSDVNNVIGPDENVKTSLSFLEDHKGTIQNISLLCRYRLDEFGITLRTIPNQNPTLSLSPQIEELDLYSGLEDVYVRLRNQSHLRKIVIGHGSVMNWNHLCREIGEIETFSQTLSEITFTFAERYCFQCDGQELSTCKSLRKLSILEVGVNHRVNSRIINCRLLPDSLRIFRTSLYPVYLETTGTLSTVPFSNFKNLEELGFDLDPFLHLIAMGKVRKELFDFENGLVHLFKAMPNLSKVKITVHLQPELTNVNQATAPLIDISSCFPKKFVQSMDYRDLRVNYFHQMKIASISTLSTFRRYLNE